MAGEMIGKIRSTPTPLDILRTVKVSPLEFGFFRWITVPWNCWILYLLPSLIRTCTLMVSPALKEGNLALASLYSASTIFIRSLIALCFYAFAVLRRSGINELFFLYSCLAYSQPESLRRSGLFSWVRRTDASNLHWLILAS